MVNVPDDLKYTESDEWIRVEDGKVRMGITDYAQGRLTDIVGVWDLPEVGTEVSKGDVIGTLESVKASAEMCAPFDGKILEIKSSLEDEPGKVNADPYGDGWVVVIEIGDMGELNEFVDAENYRARIER